MNRVVNLYLNPPTDGMVWCVDEKTGIQALRRKAAKIPVRCGHCQRVEFEYERKGTASLLAAFDAGSGHVVGRCITKLHDEKNDSATFIQFLQDLMKYPAKRHGKLYIVLDNGSSHTSNETTAFFEKHRRQLEPVFLPTHSSWLNQVEMWFSVLTRRVLRHASYDSVQELMGAITAYIGVHNHHKKHPYKWTKKGQPLTL